MDRVFEDLFMEIQEDMVFWCYDYANGLRGNVDKIYVYGSFETNMISNSYFYEVNGKIYERHNLNKASKEYDVSPDRQGECLRKLCDEMESMIDLCEKYDRPMPTEIKLIYDVKKHTLESNYSYDNKYTEHPTKTSDDIADEWLEEIKNTL